MPLKFRLDSAGDVVVQPVTGWSVASSEAGRLVFLALEYLDGPEQLETGERGQLQGTLSPRRAMEIAAALMQAAGRLMELPSKPPGGRVL
jgi:hypothetical protein